LDRSGRVHVEGNRAIYDAAEAYARKSAAGRSQFDSISALTGRAEPTVVIVSEIGFISWFDPRKNTIYWSPNTSISYKGQGGRPGNEGTWDASPALVLLHEVAHAVGFHNNPNNYGKANEPDGTPYDNPEEKRVITGVETPAAKQLGEPTRTTHGGTPNTEPAPVVPATEPRKRKTPCGGAQEPCNRRTP